MNTAYLVAGLAYGDEGKGAIVDYLVRQHRASLVVRYNGGAQAAHNVITPDGKHHTFAQFGSGTLAGAKTHLSKHVLIEPFCMMNEAKHLQELGVENVWQKITVEKRALVITPFQMAANRIIAKHQSITKSEYGTCGMGIGTTREDHLAYGDKVLFACDLRDKEITIRKLRFLQAVSYAKVKAYTGCKPQISGGLEESRLIKDLAEFYWDTRYKDFPATIVDDRYLAIAMRDQNVVFEGAQGMLLDEKYGIAPHNTWTDITFNNANELLAKANYAGKVERIGVLRTYFTRHGAGPFEEDANMHHVELHNNSGGFQGNFRQGNFDFAKARYALRAIGGVDVIALNHLDCLSEGQSLFVRTLADYLNVDKFILGFGPSAKNKKERSNIRSVDAYYDNDNIRGSLCCS